MTVGDPPGPPALRFAYMVIAVADLPLMRAWYERVLGFALAASGSAPAAGTDFAVLEGQGMRLELAVRHDGAPQSQPRVAPPEAIDLLGFRVMTLETADLAALDRHLAQSEADVLWSMRQITPRFCSTLIRDPEGNLINIFGLRDSAN